MTAARTAAARVDDGEFVVAGGQAPLLLESGEGAFKNTVSVEVPPSGRSDRLVPAVRGDSREYWPPPGERAQFRASPAPPGLAPNEGSHV